MERDLRHTDGKIELTESPGSYLPGLFFWFIFKFQFVELLPKTHVIARRVTPDVAIRSPCHPERPEGVEGSTHYHHCIAAILCGMSYFLTDEKVCKESPRTFRMVLGLSGRPKGKAY